MAVKRMDNIGIVVDDLVATIDFFRELEGRATQLVGEVVTYKDIYRHCYIRGPKGLLIGLAEELR